MTPAALDLTFAALADPTRRAILSRLVKGEACVNELRAPFDLSQPTISKHLKVLVRAGLVTQRRHAQFRPVRLNAARLEQAWAWLGDYRQFWEESFNRLETFAKQLHEAEKKGRPRGRKKKRRA